MPRRWSCNGRTVCLGKSHAAGRARSPLDLELELMALTPGLLLLLVLHLELQILRQLDGGLSGTAGKHDPAVIYPVEPVEIV